MAYVQTCSISPTIIFWLEKLWGNVAVPIKHSNWLNKCQDDSCSRHWQFLIDNETFYTNTKRDVEKQLYFDRCSKNVFGVISTSFMIIEAYHKVQENNHTDRATNSVINLNQQSLLLFLRSQISLISIICIWVCQLIVWHIVKDYRNIII